MDFSARPLVTFPRTRTINLMLSCAKAGFA